MVIPENVTSFDVSNVFECEWLSQLTILNQNCELKETSINLKIPKQVVLAGYTGSTIEQYAYENNYHFLPLDGENAGVIQNHKYSVDWKTVLPATCTERGLMVKVCNICSDVESKVIAPFGHTDKNNDNICDVCEVVLSADQITEQQPTEPETPKEEKNIFEKIIEWFRNLFNNLFGWLN